MPGQHCAGEVVEAPGAGLAAISLPSALRVVTPVPDNREAVTPRTTHAIGPAMLAHQGEALGVVQKSREVDQIGCRHDDRDSSRKPDGCLCSSYHTRCPAGTLSKPTTPEADKSQSRFSRGLTRAACTSGPGSRLRPGARLGWASIR